MIDNLIKAATFRVTCGDAFGTAWLISETSVITARHCVLEAIENGQKIELVFQGADGERRLPAQIAAHNEDFDVCLLSIAERLESQPLPVSKALPREGSQWRSFGFPNTKSQIGHRIAGAISHVLETPKLRMDMDLTVDPSSALTSYQGLSGAPVVSEGMCVGILRLKVDGTIGAISTQSITKFLEENGVQLPPSASEQRPQHGAPTLAERATFQRDFEKLVGQAGGEYLFLEGAHGIGKTTFCNEYKPMDKELLVLGTYSLSTQSRGAGAIVRAQPDIFFDWLSTAISTLVTGKPPRKEDRNYATLVSETAGLLQAFAKYCESHGQRGMLFIDGINEAHAVDPGALAKFIGLLPSALPSNLSVVITAPNYHAVSSYVLQYVKSKNVTSLPRLSDEACAAYCRGELSEQRCNPTLVGKICEKAQGHPLYLRYLIEYVNGSDQESLDEFPVLSGTIEEYYESLWSRLLSDADALNLLAIIARLRWGILTTEILRLLLPAEKAVFVPTINRIRHLLQDRDSTEIYHSSFAEFIRAKTSELEQVVQDRIANFCSSTADIEYCTLNVVFHQLRSGDDGRSKAIATCRQQWVDACVTLGVEPDVLLVDIEETLSAATQQAKAVEVIRLLLLLQRVSFRYNTLFAQSAYLIAEAMIALDRPQEAIKHAIRFGTLIVSADEALKIAFRLIDNGHHDHAFEILKPLHQKVIEAYSSDSSHSYEDYVNLNRLRIRINMYAQMADGNDRSRTIAGILRRAHRILTDNLNVSNPDMLEQCSARIQCVVTGMLLYFYDRYLSTSQLKQLAPNADLPPAYLTTLLFGLLECSDLIDEFGKPSEITSLPQLFADFRELLSNESSLDSRVSPLIIDPIIELGAPSDMVRMMSEKVSTLVLNKMQIVKENGVDVAFADVRRGLSEWRAKSYLDDSLECPLIGAFDETNWLTSLEQLLCAVAWCEGRARRAVADNNQSSSQAVLNALKSRVLSALKFSLAGRVNWENSYAIPEAVFPIVWERVAIVLRDCYSSELPCFVDDLTARIPSQCGLYSEGFRKSMSAVVSSLAGCEIDGALNESLFKLLLGWKDYVISGVENRHELVPELLKLIPLFVKVGARQEADGLYRHVLSVSMGPSWYKEDQLGLMTTVLQQLPTTDALGPKLSTIAGYLERASGEMTFQRFIRHEKATFLGELFRRNMYAARLPVF